MAKAPLHAPPPEDRVTITCLYCRGVQEVSRKAMSITCRHCNKSLKLEDRVVSQYLAQRQLDTCGTVVIEKRGNVSITDRILCGGLVVRGKLKGNVTSRGTVLIGSEAEVRGDVEAPRLAVGAGAVLSGFYRIGPESR